VLWRVRGVCWCALFPVQEDGEDWDDGDKELLARLKEEVMEGAAELWDRVRRLSLSATRFDNSMTTIGNEDKTF
jgi:hypothetical protein